MKTKKKSNDIIKEAADSATKTLRMCQAIRDSLKPIGDFSRFELIVACAWYIGGDSGIDVEAAIKEFGDALRFRNATRDPKLHD